MIAKRRVGSTDVQVSVLGLGGAPLGNLFEYIPEPQAEATVQAALTAGVSYFDVAPQYGHGQAEHRFGNVLRHADRPRYVLSTKVGRLLVPVREAIDVRWSGPINFRIEHDYSYDGVMRSVEASYHRLGLSRIDIALIHDVDVAHQGDDYDRQFDIAVKGAVRALEELKRNGEVGAIGIGVNEIEPCLRFASACALDAFMLAGRYTLLQHQGIGPLLDVATAQGCSLLIAGPFNSGILATGTVGAAPMHNYKPAQKDVIAQVRRIEQRCKAHGIALAAAAIQFPLMSPRVASVVTGATRPEEIITNQEHVTSTIPGELWTELVQDGIIDPRLLPAAMPA